MSDFIIEQTDLDEWERRMEKTYGGGYTAMSLDQLRMLFAQARKVPGLETELARLRSVATDRATKDEIKP